MICLPRLIFPSVLLLAVPLTHLAADENTTPADGNRLAYLDESNPWYPHKDFPKLITPQWVGEDGVEAVVVLAIDDMRDTAKYEQYLRPILNRLKQIDGRAPVSIMTCEVKPDDPQLQSWLEEGLSIEVHTIDHPCPLLQGSLEKARSTYDRCVDLLNTIPGNKPVAFRTPCCDSLNTVSPRFYSEIFDSVTPEGNYLQIDSSVFNFFTSEDESVPRELVLDEDGNERFWKYLPTNNTYKGVTHNNFVNYIKNYPYPYVINNTCWQFPCVAPSDWSAQHLHGVNNPQTVEDWKAALDITVHKQGVFNLVFHPHGWITAEQIVELIDHAVEKHGKKVKFLTFREAAERLNQTFFFGTQFSPSTYNVRFMQAEGIRFIDLNHDDIIDVVYGGRGTKLLNGKVISDSDQISAIWSEATWNTQSLPFSFESDVSPEETFRGLTQSLSFYCAVPAGEASAYHPPKASGFGLGNEFVEQPALSWTFGNSNSQRIRVAPDSSGSNEKESATLLIVKFLDLDSDGISEALGSVLPSRPDESLAIYRQVVADDYIQWRRTRLQIPRDWDLADLAFEDVDGNGLEDLCHFHWKTLNIQMTESTNGVWRAGSERTFSVPYRRRPPVEVDGEPQVFVGGFGVTDNGFFVHDRHLCWQNEDTAHLPDMIHCVSFDELLAKADKREASAEGTLACCDSSQISLSSEPESSTEPQDIDGLLNERGDKSPRSKAAALVPVGAAIIDITPDYPVRLTGYGGRTEESEGIASPIHARALAIGGNVAVTVRATSPENPSDQSTAAAPQRNSLTSTVERDGTTETSATYTSATPHHSESDGYVEQPLTVLLTVDNCGVPDEVTEVVFARLAEKHGITRERFAITSSHTHSAPWLRDFAPLILTGLPDDQIQRLEKYEVELIEKLVKVVSTAIEIRRPGRLSMGTGKVGFAKNRRALKEGQWVGFGEADEGPVDRRLPVLAAHDEDGKLIAVLANYACHATTETGQLNEISGDWPGYAADMIEADHPGTVALIAIGTGADANPSPRGTHELAVQHGRELADEVKRLLKNVAVTLRVTSPEDPSDQSRSVAPVRNTAPSTPVDDGNTKSSAKSTSATPHHAERDGYLKPISPDITCKFHRIDLPLGPLPSREEWEERAKQDGPVGNQARYFLDVLKAGEEIPTTVPDYPVQTWCFGDDLAMVFLGGEVVVDYSIRMNDMFDGDKLWINAYSNDVPCYIASKRILREGGYEADSSMRYYARPARLSPDAEDLICDTVQKLLPPHFYSEELQVDFPAPKSPKESLASITTRPGLNVELVASEPLINDPVAFDWDVQGRLWVVEMGDYPSGRQEVGTLDEKETGGGRVRVLTDTDKDGRYDEATTFLDGLPFPTGICRWRNGVIITAAPDVFYAEDTDGDGQADVRQMLYTGFGEGNQQHRVNGLRWGLDGWLYLGNGDSDGEIRSTGFGIEDSGSSESHEQASDADPESSILNPRSSSLSVSGRDIRIQPDSGRIDTVSGRTQYGRERDDFGNWFGNNNSNPIWHYVFDEHYINRNPFALVPTMKAEILEIPGAGPVYPTSRTLARFNDFDRANRFTSACSTMIYRDKILGEEFYGNAFTCEPVHNLVSRRVIERDGVTFRAFRDEDERESEFLASSDNWFRPTMVRTGPDGALYVSDMYRFVIEHPTWVPAEYQRKLNLRAGEDRGRIYRVVPAQPQVAVTLRVTSPENPSDRSRAVASRRHTLTASVEHLGNAERFAEPTPATPHHSESDGYGCCGNISHSEALPRNALPGGSASDRAESRGWLITKAQVGASRQPVPGQRSGASARSWFAEPWNEVPIEGLVARMASPNGWWRDTAHRILLHRNDQAAVDGLVKLATQHASEAVRVQAAYAVAQLSDDRDDVSPLLVNLLSDESPEVRRQAIRLLEQWLRDDTFEPPAELLQLTEDSSPAVVQQLAYSLGESVDTNAAMALAKVLKDHSDNKHITAAAMSSLTPDNVGSVLNGFADGSGSGGLELFGQLIAQAAEFEKMDVVFPPLKKLLAAFPAATEPLPEHWRALAEISRQIRRHKQVDAAVREEAGLTKPWLAVNARARELTMNVAHADSVRIAAMKFLAAGDSLSVNTQSALASLLEPTASAELQRAAIEAMANSDGDQLLITIMERWNHFTPAVRSTAVDVLLRRKTWTDRLLESLESGRLQPTDIDAVSRERLTRNRDTDIAERAKKIFKTQVSVQRMAVIDELRPQIESLTADSNSGKLIFEKKCATCHKLQEIGKSVGADLAALADRSTDALLTAILDPNRAVESKFLSYVAVTHDGLSHTGMLLNETGNSVTLLTSDGKEQVVPRADIDQLLATGRSLMPEGLEKDLSPQNLADTIAFVQTAGAKWKQFPGNSPRVVTPNADGTLTLPADAAEVFGPNLAYEPKHSNLGWWQSTDDRAVWTIDSPRGGHWNVVLEYACDNGTAGNLLRLSTGTRMLTARVPGTGTWDDYNTWTAGRIDLHAGRHQITATALEQPTSALIDLKAIHLIPPE